jgi:hypothetical protein
VSDKPKFTLAERFAHGLFTLDEVAALKKCSKRKLYIDAANGLLIVEKHGRSSRVTGPNARAYLEGEPEPASVAA